MVITEQNVLNSSRSKNGLRTMQPALLPDVSETKFTEVLSCVKVCLPFVNCLVEIPSSRCGCSSRGGSSWSHRHICCVRVCVCERDNGLGFWLNYCPPGLPSILLPCNFPYFFSAFLAHLIYSNSWTLIKERMFPSWLWVCLFFVSCKSTCMCV